MQSDKWSIVQAKAKLSEVIRRSRKKPQIIQADGFPVAVVLPFDKFSEFEQITQESLRKTRAQTLAELASLAATLPDDDDTIDSAFPPRTDRPIPDFEDDK